MEPGGDAVSEGHTTGAKVGIAAQQQDLEVHQSVQSA